MGDDTHIVLGRTPRRRPLVFGCLVASGVVVALALVLVVGWFAIGYSSPPPRSIHYQDREYRLSGPWTEREPLFPGDNQDPTQMGRAAGLSWRYRAILEGPSPAGVDPGSVSTVICVQALDGSFWTYVLVGGP